MPLHLAWASRSVLAGSSGKLGRSYMALSDIALDVVSSFLPHCIGYKQVTESSSDSKEGKSDYLLMEE